MKRRVILIIPDGWGIATDPLRSAVDQAHTPYFDKLLKVYPHARLSASGPSVGLPEGQMGNSEVGHMNMGAGRIVYQDLVKIDIEAEHGRLVENPALRAAFDYVLQNGKQFHFIGLVSDGGVHAHINHLKKLCEAAEAQGLSKVFIHAFTDGRDTDPKSGAGFLEDLEKFIKNKSIHIASVIGRYYAMDRDKRWERVKYAYDALVKGEGKKVQTASEGIRASYKEGITDEFIKPLICTDTSGEPLTTIKPGDAVLCFNFRTDRGREITTVLTQQDLPEFDMHTLPLYYLTMTNYDDSFKNIHVLYDKEDLHRTLGEVLSNAGKKQLRIAETEKYPHVTFFFSGGREEPFKGEDRILCPSPKVATYDLQPEMSAEDIRDAAVREIEAEKYDFICLNFANPDMVGHTGVFSAAVQACETVDRCLKDVTEIALRHNYTVIIAPDHGNADCMINEDGSPNTAHTLNPVPCIVVDWDLKSLKLKDGVLADIAPTILKLMGIPQPSEMTGKSLL